MSFSCVKQYRKDIFRVAAVSAASFLSVLLIIGVSHAQRGGENWERGEGMSGPPQRMEMRPAGEMGAAVPQRVEMRPQGEMRGEALQPAMAVTTESVRQGDGSVVVTTTSGDDISVEVRPSPQGEQGGFQPGQGGPGQGGFQPGGGQGPQGQGQQGRPGQQQGRPQQGGQQQGGPQQPTVARSDRVADNTPNEYIAKLEFNADGEERELRIMFQGAAWRSVLEWFAGEAGLSLELESAPPGSFSYRDETNTTHSIDETFNLLNSYLIRRNFLMIRTGRMLMLVNLNDGLPVDLIRDVPLEKLDEVGDFEVVRVLFNLSGTTPDVVQAEIQQMIGPQGLVVALNQSLQIYVTEFGDKLRTIRDVIKNLDDPSINTDTKCVILEFVSADTAVTQLKALLPLADNDSTLRVLIASDGSSIWLSGRRDRVAKAKHMLEIMDQQVDTSDVTLKVYPVLSAEPRVVLSIVQTLLAGRPDVRASLDTNIGAIVVQGRTEDHEKVKDAIDKLEDDGYSIVNLQLVRNSTESAIKVIETYFGSSTSTGTTSSQQRNPFQPGGASTSSSSTSIAPPVVTANISRKQLIVRGTRAQIEQIKVLLISMGETNLDAVSSHASSEEVLRHIPTVSEKQAEIVLQLTQQMLTQMGHQPLNVTPTNQLRGPSPDTRTQPVQFNQQPQQPYQPLRPQDFEQPQGNMNIPQNDASLGSQQLLPDGSPLPDYMVGTPSNRIHVIDGLADENASQNDAQPVQAPRAGQSSGQGTPGQSLPLPGNTSPNNNSYPNNNAYPNGTYNNALPAARSQVDSRLDDLFGPVTESLPATQPGYMPSSTPQSVPTGDRLSTGVTRSGEYLPAAYRQNEFAATPATEAPAETISQPGTVETVIEAPAVQTQLFSVENEANRQPRDRAPQGGFDDRGPQRGFDSRPDARDERRPQRGFEGEYEQGFGPAPGFDAGQPAQSLGGTPQAYAGQAPATQAPAAQGGEVTASYGPGGILLTGPPEQLNIAEELIHAMNSEVILKSQSTEFYLITNAKADTIKTMLTSLLGTSSTTGSTSNDSLLNMPSDPIDALMVNMFGGSKIQATGAYEILVDARSNMLIINANRVDHLTIQELLPILDRLGRAEDLTITAKPHLIPLEFMKAEDAETAVRTIFAENLQGAGQGGGNRGNQQQQGRGNQQQQAAMMMPGMMMGPGGMGGPQELMQMMARARGGQQQNQQISQVEVQTMTLSVETTTNSLIVYSPEELFLQVEAFVKELDRLSQYKDQTSTVVPGVRNYSAAYLTQLISAMCGDTVTVTNNTTNSTSTNRNAANRGGFGGGAMGGGMMGGGGGMTMGGGGAARGGGGATAAPRAGTGGGMMGR